MARLRGSREQQMGDLDEEGRGNITRGAEFDEMEPIEYRDPIAGRGGESARERSAAANTGANFGGTTSVDLGSNATPTRPRSPEPQAGSLAPPPQGLTPFAPMGSPEVGSMQTPHFQGLFGGAGGLTGGGLGLPLDPTSDFESDPISTLLKLLGQA